MHRRGFFAWLSGICCGVVGANVAQAEVVPEPKESWQFSCKICGKAWPEEKSEFNVIYFWKYKDMCRECQEDGLIYAARQAHREKNPDWIRYDAINRVVGQRQS